MYSVLKIISRKFGTALKCEFLDLVHVLQSEIYLDKTFDNIEFLSSLRHSVCMLIHMDTFYVHYLPMPPRSFVWYVICNVFSCWLKCWFVFSLISAFSSKAKNSGKQNIKMIQLDRYLCMHTFVFYTNTLRRRVAIFFLSCLHICFPVYINLALRKPGHSIYGNLIENPETAYII